MPRQVDHGQRRDEMAEALWRVAADEGLEAVSLNRVADEAGVSKGRLQHYFPSRDALLDYAAEHVQHRVSARLRARVDGSSGLAAARGALLEVLPLTDDSVADTRVGSAFFIRALREPVLRAYYRDRNRMFLELLTGFLAEADLAPDREPAEEAVVLFALVNGLKEPLLLGDLSPERATTILDAALAALA